ncbi:sterol desaturase family protein [Albitalea terrae]|uniref:Sterol desaturase family protein n=2 Tax=Piscinibacter terrae TaxID=2496871 RepID=A0A3N7IVK0_9BURK|nr:sterol desaturase family protein [Albitalea terrae]
MTRQLYLLAVGGSLAAFWMARSLGWPVAPIVLGWSVLVLATGALLERIAPFDPRWVRSGPDTTTDLTSAAVVIGLVDPAVKAAMPVLAATWFGASPGADWPAATWPFVAQAALAVLWIEFAKYGSHRAHHEVRSLWWLHAMHHGSERLYWLNNFRFHPVNHLINTFAAMFPLITLGAPQDVLLAAVAFTQPVLMLQHLNVDTRNGWLNRVLNTNELHRWHHSAEPREANSNYGSALVLWDRVFGTYRPQPGRPSRIGLFGNGHGYPAQASYLQQLLSSLTPACCRA